MSSGALRLWFSARARRAIGLAAPPPPICTDPNLAYLPVGGTARLIHADLGAMLVGGVSSLLLQMLHPYAMAGVAEHSRYREDPLGRLQQTAAFIATTTYGTTDEALAAVARVQRRHRSVTGRADDGTPYEANSPHLLAWIHVAETWSFLHAYRRFGARTLTNDDADEYVAQVARIARDLGVVDPPTDERALDAALGAFRGELRRSAAGDEARDFLLGNLYPGLLTRVGYRVIVGAALDVMPEWAFGMLEAPPRSSLRRTLERPLQRGVCRAMRLVVPPPPANASEKRDV